MDRRTLIFRSALAGAGLAAYPVCRLAALESGLARFAPLFEISLAQWSVHRMLQSGQLDALAFPTFAREEFDFGAVEYVNTFFQDRARDHAYLGELRARAFDANVRSLLIMVDAEGRLGDPDTSLRTEAVEKHYRWVEAAQFLGCHSIRVNAASVGSPDTQRDLAVDGLRRLTECAAGHDLNVIVENHGGVSSNGVWLAEVIRQVDHHRCGTLPDFGNFDLGNGESYDRYRGVQELMPFARAVSAKSYAFGTDGDETTIDFRRMMRIVLDAGYRGYVGIEFEGDGLSEKEGIGATKSLLEAIRSEFQADPAFDAGA
ncbi:MAG: sugar phosphate isomerase/epimerase [Gemmatimonadales bacterium]|nr:MAG: sugar phosphate isomerase/epimerase [Gemmatimonadales bacterium]